jgi:lysophospholipase L1-like esterase
VITRIGRLLLFAVVMICGCQPYNGYVRTGTVFLGDSIFFRWDLTQYFPSKGYTDAGIARQTTSEILNRLPDTLTGQKVCSGDGGVTTCQTIPPPHRVVIYAGRNNLFQGSDPQAAVADIELMVQQCLQAGAIPIIATVYHFAPAFPSGAGFDAPADQINQGLRALGPKYNIPVIDLEQVFLDQSNYTLDGVHPNSFGYSQMESAFAAALN